MQKFLIIQTAFVGDVVLVTALVEKLRAYYPEARIDYLLRKGNEALLQNNPGINNIVIWDKQKGKKRNLIKLAFWVRKQGYTHVINPHRFFTSGFITFLSGAKYKAGFDKNPMAFCYTKKVKHVFSEPYAKDPIRETDRNQLLISDITDATPARPKLYPSDADREKIKRLQSKPYICIAPSSVWFTKQFPAEKWAVLINSLPGNYTVYLLGGASDAVLAEKIMSLVKRADVKSTCGSFSYLQSAALMQGAVMNYTNDSGPLHFASATNAPVTAVYCSTIQGYGFGPLSDNNRIVAIREKLYCRPCGLHGHKTCPQGHFRCAWEIENEDLLWWTSKTT